MIGNGTSSIITNNNLHWDNTNTRLGIGNSSPAYTLDVSGTGLFTDNLYIKKDGSGGSIKICPQINNNEASISFKQTNTFSGNEWVIG